MVKDGQCHIKLNNVCNSNCNFCADDYKVKGKKEPTLENLIQRIKSFYDSGFRALMISGGEPTLSNNLLKVASFAKKLGFSTISIATNARMLSIESYLDKLIVAGVNKFQVSYFAHTQELYDSISRVKGSFLQVLKGLMYLRAKKCVISFNCVLTRENILFLKELYLEMLAFNPKHIQFAFPNPHGNCLDDFDSIVPTYKEVSVELNKFLNLFSKFIPRGQLFIENVPLCYLNKKYHFYTTEYCINSSELPLRRYNKTRDLDICSNCEYYDVCFGIWSSYVLYRPNDI